jgi:dipeptidase D
VFFALQETSSLKLKKSYAIMARRIWERRSRMLELGTIEAKQVFTFFQEITQIPHGSGNTERMAAYCMEFAKARNLRAVQDAGGNVVIYKQGTAGYENSQPVILQGHLDMVCAKAEGCKLDMTREGIHLCTDGTYIWADGTTLGADDGIAMAYMFAVLDSHEISHPPIEALFTNDEEIGMLGARSFDASLLSGKRLINMDSEEEGILTVSCAGGVRAYCEFALDFIPVERNMAAYLITVHGLKGGHSGIDMNKQRKSAHLLMGRVLQHIARTMEFGIAAIKGGEKTNVIPNYGEVIVCVDKKDAAAFLKEICVYHGIIREELKLTEPDVKIEAAETHCPEVCTDWESTRKVLFTLQQIPDGIQTMSPDIPNMVQTSLNMGELILENQTLKMGYLIRSNASTGKQLTVQKLQSFVDYLYGKVTFAADYPVWEYRPDSPLRDIMVEAYEQVYAHKPTISSIHAGLECGILSGKIPEADMVSFGPNLENVHTAKERMSISSAVRCWKYLVRVLEMLK